MWHCESGCLTLHYILKFKFFFKNTCFAMTAWIHVGLLESECKMIFLPKQVCLTIIHKNTTHILDISISRIGILMEILKYVCSYTICILNFFPSNKSLSNYVERVTTHYQTLQTRIGQNASRYLNLNALPNALRIFYQLTWFGGYLQRFTTRYHQIYIKNVY